MDSFTKRVDTVPTKNNTAKTTVRVLVGQVFFCWGTPQEIDSRKGSYFTADIIKEVCQALGIKQTLLAIPRVLGRWNNQIGP